VGKKTKVKGKREKEKNRIQNFEYRRQKAFVIYYLLLINIYLWPPSAGPGMACGGEQGGAGEI